ETLRGQCVARRVGLLWASWFKDRQIAEIMRKGMWPGLLGIEKVGVDKAAGTIGVCGFPPRVVVSQVLISQVFRRGGRDLYPSDEDLSPGIPDLGHPAKLFCC
ncbi:MAG TPA: hypothetical protein VE291_02915, partial [Terracidiphilus sp.]|nr:hypothetical protein [Terracidiphilus sp.]